MNCKSNQKAVRTNYIVTLNRTFAFKKLKHKFHKFITINFQYLNKSFQFVLF